RPNLRLILRYWQSLGIIHDAIARHRPDVVLNFFEPLVGLCYMVHRPRVPLACVANQYLLLNPDYPFPPGQRLDRWLVQFYSRLTAFGARKMLALSLKPMSNFPTGVVVVPPLLRPEILSFEPQGHEPFLLIYLLKTGFRGEIIAWHRRH